MSKETLENCQIKFNINKLNGNKYDESYIFQKLLTKSSIKGDIEKLDLAMKNNHDLLKIEEEIFKKIIDDSIDLINLLRIYYKNSRVLPEKLANLVQKKCEEKLNKISADNTKNIDDDIALKNISEKIKNLCYYLDYFSAFPKNFSIDNKVYDLFKYIDAKIFNKLSINELLIIYKYTKKTNVKAYIETNYKKLFNQACSNTLYNMIKESDFPAQFKEKIYDSLIKATLNSKIDSHINSIFSIMKILDTNEKLKSKYDKKAKEILSKISQYDFYIELFHSFGSYSSQSPYIEKALNSYIENNIQNEISKEKICRIYIYTLMLPDLFNNKKQEALKFLSENRFSLALLENIIFPNNCESKIINKFYNTMTRILQKQNFYGQELQTIYRIFSHCKSKCKNYKVVSEFAKTLLNSANLDSNLISKNEIEIYLDPICRFLTIIPQNLNAEIQKSVAQNITLGETQSALAKCSFLCKYRNNITNPDLNNWLTENHYYADLKDSHKIYTRLSLNRKFQYNKEYMNSLSQAVFL